MGSFWLEPETLTLKRQLECYRDYRIEVIRRRTRFLLDRAEADVARAAAVVESRCRREGRASCQRGGDGLEPTLEARAQLAGVFRQTRPRWIFAPYWIDAHPDHVAATELIEAARFWSKLSKTDMPGEPHHPEKRSP